MSTALQSEELLLAALDDGAHRTGLSRAALLAGLSRAPGGEGDIGALTPGERDRQILRVREELLGGEIEAQDTCRSCGETVTFTLDAAELGGVAAVAPAPLRVGDSEVIFRVPTIADLARAAGQTESRAARGVLLEAAIVTIDGTPPDVDALSDEVVSAVSKGIADADPLSEISLTLVCDVCQGRWISIFDPVEFVWTEMQEWRSSLLLTVHVLARRYGWTESDVLALSRARRSAYVELALGG